MRDLKNTRFEPLGHRPVRTTSRPSTQTQVHQDLRAIASHFNPRSWENIGQQGRHTLRVMTYNLLSNNLAQVDPRLRNNRYIPDPTVWALRRNLLLNEIGAINADIICVQELDEVDHEGHFGATVRGQGYESTFKKRKSTLDHGFAIFYRTERTTLVRECPIPCPQREVVQGIEDAGVMLVLDVAEGAKTRRVCVGTTHIVSDGNQGFRKLGQIVALISTAEALMKEDPCMPLILTGDFNAYPTSQLIKYVLEGTANFAQMPAEDFWKSSHVVVPQDVQRRHQEMVGRFKTETLNLRDAVKAPAFAASTEGHWSLIKGYWEDMEDPVVDHTLHLSSVYDMGNIVDFIFYGAMIGHPRLEAVSRLVLPRQLARLKAGLPGSHFGSDHFALAAEFRFADEVDGVDGVGEEVGGAVEEPKVELVVAPSPQSLRSALHMKLQQALGDIYKAQL
ncbi:Protein angel 2 [Mortierella alpina]|nr:Protein angel 2 [Mortierella alpina]